MPNHLTPTEQAELDAAIAQRKAAQVVITKMRNREKVRKFRSKGNGH